MAAINGSIMPLQKFSVDDGAGVRTMVFLPGCPLRCKWCSNPESWELSAKFSQYHQVISACDVVRQVERDAVFFRYSGGGVTFSGGEPTVQTDFLRALACGFESKGISMWMETCGYFNFNKVKDILVKMEHVLYDIKCMDSALHKNLTGADNYLILENAIKLYALGVPITVRLPALNGVNFTEKNLKTTARFMRENLPGADIEFLPYHSLGKEKYEALGIMACWHEFAAPGIEEIETAKELFNCACFQ